MHLAAFPLDFFLPSPVNIQTSSSPANQSCNTYICVYFLPFFLSPPKKLFNKKVRPKISSWSHHFTSAFGADLLIARHSDLMWHGRAAIGAFAVPAGSQAAAAHPSLSLTSASYSLTSASTSSHSAHFIISTSHRDSHNKARGMLTELSVRTFRSTTFWGAMGSSGRMDMGCPFLYQIQSQSQNLFQIPVLFLLAFLSPLFKRLYSFLHFFHLSLQPTCHIR